MSGKYVYKKLDRSKLEIRLLELLPKTHKLSKIRPTCRVSHISLKENPKFVALSYVWGEPDDKRTILVDKRPFRVTRNLYDAMMALQPEKESIIIWIDAICINQSPNNKNEKSGDKKNEKSWQVGLMGDIYRQSSNVIAWLGTAADGSDSVIDYLNTLGEKAEACGLDYGPDACMQIWGAMTTTPSYMDDPEEIVYRHRLDGEMKFVSKHDLQSLLHSINGSQSPNSQLPVAKLKRLFLRPWWGRIWVLQEITLPEHAYFVCGTKQISRRRFRAAYNSYYALWFTTVSKMQQGKVLTSHERELQSMALHRASVMLSMRRIHQSGGFPLVALLRATCVGSIHLLKDEGHQHLISTNPRDKIFALLGLAVDSDELKRLGVLPDYKKTKRQTYITTMAALLQQGHMSMLSLCLASETSRDLPSWVPDWSLPMIETFQDVEDDHLTLCPKFNASASKPHRAKPVFTKREKSIKSISLMAGIYDTVLEVGKVKRVPETGTCLFDSDWLFEMLRLTYKAKDVYSSFDARLRAVVRTSHTTIGVGNAAKLERVGDDRFLDALPIMKGAMHTIPQHGIKAQLQHYLASKGVKKMMKSGAGVPARILQDFMRVSVRRSPFVTERGNLGLSSQYVKKGDVVVLIGGAQVPFILRSNGDAQFTVVSEAYVDGIMDGEAAGDVKWRDIELA